MIDIHDNQANTYLVQVTKKDGWSIIRGWAYTLDEDGRITSIHKKSYRARYTKDSFFTVLDAVKIVWKDLHGVAESIDYHNQPDTGEIASGWLMYFQNHQKAKPIGTEPYRGRG